jgi:phosphate-selective porin OprO and OprP
MKRVLLAAILIALFSAPSFAQLGSQVPYFTFGKGLGITSPDSLFLMNIRFRMQNRVGLQTTSVSDWNPDDIEARVRRLRLRFDGYVYSPKLTYVLQLSFSRGDIDFEDSGFPNIIRDAMVIYNFNKHFAVGIGQTKLPGNRQRVNSSGDLQLPDRSIVNSEFNVDRDFGVQLYYRNAIRGFNYVLRGAVSSGDGRNFNNAGASSTTSNDLAVNGLCYTGRIELLPFGEFTNNGDYFEGDLAREPKPKLSIGGGFSNNENAKRSGGQLGKYLYESRDIETTMFDALYKHNGWAFAAEYLNRYAKNPITIDPDDATNEQHVYAGHGQNYQGSYLFRNNYEIVARYSQVTPNNDIQSLEPQLQQYTLGATKYLRGHRVKLQTEFTYAKDTWLAGLEEDHDYFIIRFQIEVGI